MTPEDRAEVEAIVQAGIAAALAVTSEALDELPADGSDAEVEEAVEDLGEQVNAIVEAVADDVEAAVDEPGAAVLLEDAEGVDMGGLPVVDDVAAEAGVDLTPDPDPSPDVEVAGVAPVVVDTAPERTHPYWRPLRRR